MDPPALPPRKRLLLSFNHSNVLLITNGKEKNRDVDLLKKRQATHNAEP
jgi:hypothetical protein